MKGFVYMQLSMSDLISIGLCVLMVVVGIKYFHKPFMKKILDNPTQECDEPQGIASLGVLGTFLGISYGLLQFNSADIEASVPVLLGGMRTAFLTSVIGMIWSMYLKYQQNKKEKEYYQEQAKVDNDATIGQLISYLKTKDKNMAENELLAKQYQEKLLASIQEINKSLVGDGDSSVITQVQLIKSKIQDGFEKRDEQSQKEHEELIGEFREFAKNMAENNSKAFIEALNSTIHDFNEKIQEQFGENFKQLNIAVGKLLDWQEQYKNTVIEVTNNQRIIFAGIEQAKSSLASMADNGNSIKDSAKALSGILVTIDSYQKELEQSLKDLAFIGSDAKKLVPNIKLLTEESNAAISSTCDNANKELKEFTFAAIEGATKFYGDVGKQLEEQSSKAVDGTKQYYQVIGDELLSTTKEMKEEYSDVTKEMKKIGAAIGDASQRAFIAVQDNSNSIEKLSLKSVQTVDKQMNSIGDALNKTVNDILKVISKHESEIDSASSRAIEAIKGASDKLQKSALEVTQRVSDNLTQISKDNNEELKQQQQNMAKNFEDAMSKSFYAFGNEMAKISQKFASDYSPLADKLREIVKIAEQIQRRGNRG